MQQPFFLVLPNGLFQIITSSSVFFASGTSSKKTFFSRPPFFHVFASIGILKTYFLSCLVPNEKLPKHTIGVEALPQQNTPLVFSAISLEEIYTLYFIFNKIIGFNSCSCVYCINARVCVCKYSFFQYIHPELGLLLWSVDAGCH